MTFYKNIKHIARLTTILSMLVGVGCIKQTNHEELVVEEEPGILEKLATGGKKFVAKGFLAKELELAELAAVNGDAEMQNNLGIIYRDGCGLAQDKNEALKWFKRAVNQGSSSGANLIGFMYLEGDGVAQDRTEATKWFLRANKLHTAQIRKVCLHIQQKFGAKGNEE